LNGNIEILQIGPPEFRRQSRVFPKLIEALINLKPDILHSHHFYSDIFAIPAARSLALPLIRSVHGITQIDPDAPDGARVPRFDWSASEISREMELESSVNRTIAVSQDLKQRLISYGFSENSIEVLYPAVETAHFAIETSPRICSRVFQVGFVGRLEPVKNPLILPLIAAATKSASQSMSFKILGHGRLYDSLQKAIRDAALDNIQILPETPLVAQEMRTFDALIVPSLSEGVPHVILEAMASRVPVVASPVGGIPEVIEDRVTGHLCHHANVECFAQRLLEFSQNDSETRAMTERAFIEVKSRFEAKNQYAQLQTIYRNVLKTGP